LAIFQLPAATLCNLQINAPAACNGLQLQLLLQVYIDAEEAEVGTTRVVAPSAIWVPLFHCLLTILRPHKLSLPLR